MLRLHHPLAKLGFGRNGAATCGAADFYSRDAIGLCLRPQVWSGAVLADSRRSSHAATATTSRAQFVRRVRPGTFSTAPRASLSRLPPELASASLPTPPLL